MLNDGLFSSETDDWPTPRGFFAALDREFGFTLDPCASAQNAKCPEYFTQAENGLAQRWTGVVFMNPPYGRAIGRWVRKAYESARLGGCVVVCLLPARTDSRWWHDYVMRANELRFISGRLRFGNAESGAPFPSVVVVFRPDVSPVVVGAIDRTATRRLSQMVLPLAGD